MNRKMAAILLAGYIVCNLCACGIDDTTQSSASKSINSSTHSSDTTENKDYTRVEFSYGANGELYYRREYVYRDGTLESVTSYRADGSESGHVDLVYDEHGNRLTDYSIRGIGAKNGLPELDQDSGQVSPIEFEYEYDSAGNMVTKTRLYNNGQRSIDEYSYDNAGRIISIKNRLETRIEETGYVQPGYAYEETSREYDANGRLAFSIEQKTSYDLSDLSDITNATPIYAEIKETSYEYNSDGKLIASRGQRTVRSREQSPQETVSVTSYATLYEYDSNGQEIVSDHRGHDSSGNEMSFRRVEQEWGDNGKLLKRSIYDNNGDLTEYTVYSEQDKTYIYEDYIIIDGQEILFERVEYTYVY